ncbi:MAG TPA: branched-chain amino acid ABC transporter permease [Baekduia sp.]|nr:branched-chain amino acid ABC transporter permease [Baekduia sp.]
MALVAAVVVAGPLLDAAGQSYWLVSLTRALLLSVLAVSTNLAWGVTGIFTLGQAVFFGFGAYAAGLLATKSGVTSLLVLAGAAGAAGVIAGLVIGAFLFFGRRRVGELYVGLVTLALTYALERLATVWDVIGAANGIPGVPLPTLLGTEIETGLPFFWVALVALVATFALGAWLLRSQFALVMRAVRDDDERAEFLGYRRPQVQLAVFTVVSGIGAIAGALYAVEEGFVSPSFLGVALSTQVLVYILLGGRGTLVGPALGVLLLEVGGQRIQESLPSEWPIIVGAMLLLVIMFLPGGVMDLRSLGRTLRRPAVQPTSTMRPEVAGADPHGE